MLEQSETPGIFYPKTFIFFTSLIYLPDRNCKHTYDKKIVLRMLKDAGKNKKPLKCPVVGCNQSQAITEVTNRVQWMLVLVF